MVMNSNLLGWWAHKLVVSALVETSLTYAAFDNTERRDTADSWTLSVSVMLHYFRQSEEASSAEPQTKVVVWALTCDCVQGFIH